MEHFGPETGCTRSVPTADETAHRENQSHAPPPGSLATTIRFRTVSQTEVRWLALCRLVRRSCGRVQVLRATSSRHHQAPPGVSTCERVGGDFVGGHPRAFAPTTLVGIFGLKHEATRRSAIATTLFAASMFETWTWSKHGRVGPAHVKSFRDRLRHLAVRDGVTAAAKSEFAQSGFLLAEGLGEG